MNHPIETLAKSSLYITPSFVIKGMTCEACVYKIKYVLGQIEGVEQVETDLKTGQTTIESNRKIAFDEIEAAIKPHTKYGVAATNLQTVASKIIDSEANQHSWYQTYYPLLLIVSFISAVAFLSAYQHDSPSWKLAGLHNFMTGFFLVFSFFKLLNIKAFAESFAMYDLLAMRWPTYGLIYPFIELGLGMACLLHFQPQMTYIADIVVMGFGAIGVIMSLLDKRKIRCACLGTVFNLPMSTVAIIENMVMVVAGIVLLMAH